MTEKEKALLIYANASDAYVIANGRESDLLHEVYASAALRLGQLGGMREAAAYAIKAPWAIELIDDLRRVR